MSTVFRFVSVFLLLAQLAFLPFVSAQEAPIQPDPSTPEMETCTLPWGAYNDFINHRLSYQAAIVDEERVQAEQIATQMQSILASNCQSVASIVQVKAEELDNTCNNLLNHLVAKNNYYVRQLSTANAIATQWLIQDILSAQNCQDILSADEDLSIDLLNQDIESNYNLDRENMVIPRESNVCFMEYGPATNFVEQIEKIQEESVSNSVLDIINGYMDQLTAAAVDMIQQERELTLLTFAKNIVFQQKSKRDYPQLSDRLMIVLNKIAAMSSHISDSTWIDDVVEVLDVFGPDIITYFTKMTELDHRSTYSASSAEDIFSTIDSQPIDIVRDYDLEDFSVQTGDRWFTFIIPATGDQKQLKIRILKAEAVYAWPTLFDEDGNPLLDEEGNAIRDDQYPDFFPTHMIFDLHYDNEKIAALDLTISYTETNNPYREFYQADSLDVALFLNPYIYTNQVTIEREYAYITEDNQDQWYTQASQWDVIVNRHSSDIRVFGPATCNLQLTYMYEQIYATDTDPEVTNLDLMLAFDNFTFDGSFTDIWTAIKDVAQYKESNPDALSAPTTAQHINKAEILLENEWHIANIVPINNTWRIDYIYDHGWLWLINERNYIMDSYDINIASLLQILDFMGSLTDETEKEPAPIYADLEYLEYCFDDNDDIVNGYFYYPDVDSMVSSYCLEESDTCGEFDYLDVDGYDLYFRDIWIDQICTSIVAEYDWVDADSDQTAEEINHRGWEEVEEEVVEEVVEEEVVEEEVVEEEVVEEEVVEEEVVEEEVVEEEVVD